MKRKLLIIKILLLSFTVVVLNVSAKTDKLTYTSKYAELAPKNSHTHLTVIEGEHSWPMAGANPERTSWTPEEVPGNLNPIWAKPIEPYISQKTQIIAAYGRLYIATAKGLYTLNAETGAQSWVYPTEMPLGNSPTVVDNVVYVGGFDRKLHAINASTGTGIWTFDEAKAGYQTNPLVINGMVYAGNRDGYFYAVNTANGQLAWKYKTDGPILYSAAYKDNTVYFASEDSHAYALNASTGSLIWKSAKLPGAGFQSWWPVVYGNRVIFSGSNNYRSTISPGIGVNLQITTVELEDVYPNHEVDPRGTKVGMPGFESGNWASGTPTINMSQPNYTSNGGTTAVTQYLEAKPWRRTYFVLDRATGNEVTYDFDGDGQPEYAPILWVGTQSGTRYPPVVGGDGVLYQSNNFYSDQWIAGGNISGWKIDTPFISIPSEGWYAVDEPQAFSAGGNLIYNNLCCDRTGGSIDISLSGNNGVYYSYDLDSKIPGYNVQSHLNDTLPYASFGAPSINGPYGYHGDTNPPIPYNGKVYMHRSNTVIAFANASSGPTLPMFNTVPVQENLETFDDTELTEQLEEAVQKMVQAGHLRPAYTSHGTFDNASRQLCGDNLTDYWHNTGETIYILLPTLPYLSGSLKTQVQQYIQSELTAYPPYLYNHIGWAGAAREIFDVPPDANMTASPPRDENHTFKSNGGWNGEGVWGRNPFGFYALWKYAETFGGAGNLYSASQSAFAAEFNNQPSDTLLVKMPHVHNAYIAGYIGFLELESLAGQPQSSQVQNELNRLFSLKASNFSIDSAYGDFGQNSVQQGTYCRTLNVANNFMFMVPELTEYLRQNLFNQVENAVEEYERVAPYWFVSLANEGFGENAIVPLFDSYALFMAKALILEEPREELDQYLDVPAFDRGDLYYISKLVTLLDNPNFGFSLEAVPNFHISDPGETVNYTLDIFPTGGFTPTVMLNVINPYPNLETTLASSTANPPGSVNLILKDLHDPSFTDGIIYKVIVTATGGGLTRNVSVYLLINSSQIFLPMIQKS